MRMLRQLSLRYGRRNRAAYSMTRYSSCLFASLCSAFVSVREPYPIDQYISFFSCCSSTRPTSESHASISIVYWPVVRWSGNIGVLTSSFLLLRCNVFSQSKRAESGEMIFSYIFVQQCCLFWEVWEKSEIRYNDQQKYVNSIWVERLASAGMAAAVTLHRFKCRGIKIWPRF